MKNDYSKLLLLYLVLTASCFNHEKINRFHSRSIEESRENGHFLGYCGLFQVKDTCLFDIDFTCWAETGEWVFDFSGPVKEQDLTFNNVFLKIKTDCVDKVTYKYPDSKEWENASLFIEPDLGYYLQIDETVLLDSVLIKIKCTNQDCIYRLIYEPFNR